MPASGNRLKLFGKSETCRKSVKSSRTLAVVPSSQHNTQQLSKTTVRQTVVGSVTVFVLAYVLHMNNTDVVYSIIT